MMTKHFIILPLFFICTIVAAQGIDPVDVGYFDSYSYNGKVTISQSDQLENFVETHVGLNKKRRGFPGYRVKIYAQNHSNARSEANSIRLRFQYSKHKAYVTYTEPNFEVLVGDFTNRFDAVSLLQELAGDYPEAYVVKTIIECPNP
ncbi:MAG: SPOR domain-containing protein [Bacteroidales bacterium]|nr:SPOR domain-containing protein [Bacteroidales bacterium]